MNLFMISLSCKKEAGCRGNLLGQEEQARIMSALDQLSSSGEGDLVFAMGDGNHSLASAKAFYERMKKQLPPEEYLRHPARYALAEIVNLHSLRWNLRQFTAS